MSSAPRPEEELRGLLAANGEEVRKIEKQIGANAAVRQKLDAALLTADDAFSYGRAWLPPLWWGRDHRLGDPRGVRRAVEKLRAALAALEAGTEHELLKRAAGDEAFQPVAASAADRLEELRVERAALEDELERRLRGPGDPKPHRMVTGSHGRNENGKTVVYRTGAILNLTDWETDARFVPVEIEVVAGDGTA